MKRAAHRLNDQLSTVERNIINLKQNTGSVSDEIENICKRLQKSLRDRCDFLKAEVGGFIILWMVICLFCAAQYCKSMSIHLHSMPLVNYSVVESNYLYLILDVVCRFRTTTTQR